MKSRREMAIMQVITRLFRYSIRKKTAELESTATSSDLRTKTQTFTNIHTDTLTHKHLHTHTHTHARAHRHVVVNRIIKIYTIDL